MIENGCDKYFPKPGFSRSASNIHGPKQSLMRVLRTFLRGKSGYSHKPSRQGIRRRYPPGQWPPRTTTAVARFLSRTCCRKPRDFSGELPAVSPGTGQRQQAPGDVSAGRQYWSRLHLARLRLTCLRIGASLVNPATRPALHRPDPIMSDFKQLSRSVKGLTVLVTGAASGMGRATALVFASRRRQCRRHRYQRRGHAGRRRRDRGKRRLGKGLDARRRRPRRHHRGRRRRRRAFRRARYRRQQCRHLRARRDRRRRL